MEYVDVERRQKIFDASVSALLEQGKPAVTEGTDKCNYKMLDHSLNEIRCAIGHGMDSESFNLDMVRHNHNVRDLVEWGVIRSLFGVNVYDDDVLFLGALQTAHDKNKKSTDFVKDFKRSCFAVAMIYGLNADVLELKPE